MQVLSSVAFWYWRSYNLSETVYDSFLNHFIVLCLMKFVQTGFYLLRIYTLAKIIIRIEFITLINFCSIVYVNAHSLLRYFIIIANYDYVSLRLKLLYVYLGNLLILLRATVVVHNNIIVV